MILFLLSVVAHCVFDTRTAGVYVLHGRPMFISRRCVGPRAGFLPCNVEVLQRRQYSRPYNHAPRPLPDEE